MDASEEERKGAGLGWGGGERELKPYLELFFSLKERSEIQKTAPDGGNMHIVLFSVVFYSCLKKCLVEEKNLNKGK